MKILFTGFEPFNGEQVNPSLEVIKNLPEFISPNINIITKSLPVVRFDSVNSVIEIIKEEKPDAVVTLGEAGGRAQITPERIAINLDDYRIPDNIGNQPIDEFIAQSAPNAYFSTLPIKAMVEKMRKRGIPASVSNTAGTFVCNHVFFGVQHYIKQNNLPIRHGFVHIPYLPIQTLSNNQPSMHLMQMVEGLCAMAEAIAENDEDVKNLGGALC